MNAVFSVIFIVATAALLFIAPQDFLPALLNGTKSAAGMALTLFGVYAVWMGLSKVAEKSGLDEKFARRLTPFCRRLFRTENKEAIGGISMNLACNLLGLGGAATPYAVKAVKGLEKDGNDFAQKLLFVINATSVQIVPTTVIALRAGAGSAAAADIFIPSLICSAFSTVLAAAIYIIGYKKWRW